MFSDEQGGSLEWLLQRLSSRLVGRGDLQGLLRDLQLQVLESVTRRTSVTQQVSGPEAAPSAANEAGACGITEAVSGQRETSGARIVVELMAWLPSGQIPRSYPTRVPRGRGCGRRGARRRVGRREGAERAPARRAVAALAAGQPLPGGLVPGAVTVVAVCGPRVEGGAVPPPRGGPVVWRGADPPRACELCCS